MRTVWKFQPVNPSRDLGEPYLFEIPGDATILRVDVQRKILTVWAEIILSDVPNEPVYGVPNEPAYGLKTFEVTVVPTGGAIPEGTKHLNTSVEEFFVWHYYGAWKQ